MVRHHLPQHLKEAGLQLLATTDALAMQAQGAMWVYNYVLEDWRFYLVTSLVDTLGRRKTYGLLLDAFDRVDLPAEMTVEDVHLGSPNDDYFRLISSGFGVDGGVVEVQNCVVNGVPVDAIIYRSVRSAPSAKEAERIEKRFAKRVKDLPIHDRRNEADAHP